jgi:hypothetical protein
MYNLESIITDIESPVTEPDDRQALLRVLKARLAQRQQTQAQPELTRLTYKKRGDSGESGESALQPQPLSPESQVSPGAADSPQSEFDDSSDAPENAKNFAAALDKLDPALRDAASDFYEHLHYKSKFARLTSLQREAVVELLRHHTCEHVARILAEPPPIGMNLHTSKAGVIRFRDDYLRCALQDGKRQSQAAAEQQRLASEESFQTANASDESFCQTTQTQIRKRLFQAAHDPASDYHEIRWLIKSLELLQKQSTTASA